MKIKKTISDKVVAANRENAKKSTGPREVAGKLAVRHGARYSSRNSLKHGFFARELVLSDAEKLELEALRPKLRAELLPETPLQEIGFEEIVCSVWRCRLAVRLEGRRLVALLDTAKDEETQTDEAGATTTISRWYVSGRQELRDAIRFLGFIRQDFEKNALLREEWREFLDKGFGPEFYELLKKWMPMNYQAILLAKSVVAHAKMLEMDPLQGIEKPNEVVIDPDQGRQMVLKLLELQLQHLRDLSQSWEQRIRESVAAQNAGAVDFAPRYFTSATRDLHRAVEWYSHLKKNDL